MSLISLIGNTPLIKIEHLNKNPRVKLYCKLEGQNPGGSVKDRAAYGMIRGALDRREIKKGDKLVEATSGNTGIALAMIAQTMGLHMTLVMPANATPERVKTMKAYGADVVLTPAEKTIEYSRKTAQEMADNQGYHLLNQFANPDNYKMHYTTTGPEIWKDTDGRITHFISSMGTTGTIMGVSRYLKEKNKDILIVGAQPKDGDRIPGIRRWSPEYLPKIYEAQRVDRIMEVSRAEAILTTRKLASQEGIMGGMSSGGALTVALRLTEEIDEGVLVSIVCDRGDRYLSSELYKGL